MSSAVDSLVLLVLAMNFLLLGTSRLSAAIGASATQGALLGLLTIAVHGTLGLRSLLVGAAAIAVKGLVIPALLRRALRDVAIRREIEPFISYVTSLLIGAVATGAAMLFADRLPLAPEHRGSLLVPASLATVLIGFLIIVTRKKAITQVIGYLVVENGIFLMGLTLHRAMPFMVEIGGLLDLLVAIFVIGIVMNHISREFPSEDAARLRSLRE